MTKETHKDVVEEAQVLFETYQRGNRSVDMTTKAFFMLRDLVSEIRRLRKDLEGAMAERDAERDLNERQWS